MTSEFTKVIFQLERDQDGFPPISIELLNAEKVDDDVYRIANAPFFVPNVSYGDLVRTRPAEVAGQMEAVEWVEESEFVSISIILLDKSMDTFLMDLLRGLNCVIEYGEFGVYRVLAVAVPPTADYESLRAQLADLKARELISFAELSLPR